MSVQEIRFDDLPGGLAMTGVAHASAPLELAYVDTVMADGSIAREAVYRTPAPAPEASAPEAPASDD